MPQAPCTPRRAGDSARHPDHPARPPRPQTATPAGHGTSTAREPPCPLWQRLARHAWDDPQDARPFSARLRHTTGWSAAHIQRVLVEYRRFLYLAVRRRGRVCPSGAVDEAWHTHLLDTPRYFGAFCPQVLGTTLHHVPDRGSGTRDDARQYRATLRAYRWAFGEPPPADIWPAPAQRWAERRRHVDLHSHWLLPRPGHAGRAMGRAACGIWQALTQVNARAVRPWAMALILPLVLTLGCTQGRISIQPGVSGAAFLKGYFWTLVALLAVGIWRSARGRPSAQGPVRATRLNPIDVAYLNGGALRAVVTALARQWQREAIAPIAESPDRSTHYVLPWRVVGAPSAAQPLHQAADTSALERATLQALGERRTPAALLTALQAPLDELHARLYAQGWLTSPTRTQRLRSEGDRLYSALWGVALLWGGLRVAYGLQHGYPVSLLVVLLIVATLLALLMHHLLPHRRSREGHAVLRQARRRLVRRSEMTLSDPHLALGVAVYGLGALGPTLQPLRDSVGLLQPRDAGGSGCGSTGCGAGSGCGGGDGGCGGGGD